MLSIKRYTIFYFILITTLSDITFITSANQAQKTEDVKANHKSITINRNDSYEISCAASNVEIKGCLFHTPDGKIHNIFAGASYEEGRISQTGNAQFSCAISIKRGLQTDNGTWICQISVVDENTHVQSLKANIDVVVTDRPVCVPKDSDKCLQDVYDWGSSWNCHHLTESKLCNGWAKDTRRCCPQSCRNKKPFTKAVCEASGGKGTCIYPNEAQCSEKQEKPRVNSVHVNIVSTSASSVTTTSSPTTQSRSTITTARSPLHDWSKEEEALGKATKVLKTTVPTQPRSKKQLADEAKTTASTDIGTKFSMANNETESLTSPPDGSDSEGAYITDIIISLAAVGVTISVLVFIAIAIYRHKKQPKFRKKWSKDTIKRKTIMTLSWN